MTAVESEDKSTWALPPLPKDVRAFRIGMEQQSAELAAWYDRQREERRRQSEAFRESLKKTSERWNDFWNREAS